MNARLARQSCTRFNFLRENSNISPRVTLEKICQFEKLNSKLKPQIQKGILWCITEHTD